MANHAETAITLTDAPDDEERTVITDGLRAYNACALLYDQKAVLN